MLNKVAWMHNTNDNPGLNISGGTSHTKYSRIRYHFNKDQSWLIIWIKKNQKEGPWWSVAWIQENVVCWFVWLLLGVLSASMVDDFTWVNVVCWFVQLLLGVLPVFITISYNRLAIGAENVHKVRSGKASLGREPGGLGWGGAHTGGRNNSGSHGQVKDAISPSVIILDRPGACIIS